MSTPVTVIAIGSSADGLLALRELLNGLPATLPAAVIIVQHQSPLHRSRLPALLARATTLQVKEAVDGESLVEGTVYIAPPGLHLSIADGELHVAFGPKVAYSRPSIDVLFMSIAEMCGERAVGVVLGGAGADGAAGLVALRKAGAATIVLDPRDARFRRLPETAIALDGHRVLSFADIAPELRRLASALAHDSAPDFDAKAPGNVRSKNFQHEVTE